MLFPYEPEQFWKSMRQMIRKEVAQAETPKPGAPVYETPGLTYKPCTKLPKYVPFSMLTKPTIYDWIRHGKLKPFKIRSRVYFLWQDIQQLLPLPVLQKLQVRGSKGVTQ